MVVQDGDEWVINGQKVWTTAGHLSDMAMCIARTDWDVPKHSGLTMFIVPMDTPGVSPRPLRQITGEAEFCETFLDDVRVPTRNVLGEPGGGWKVVQTWLTYEHGGVEEGDQSGRGVSGAKVSASLVDGAFPKDLVAESVERDLIDDPRVRDRLARTFIADAVNGMVGRHLGIAMRDGRISGHAGSMVKVAAADGVATLDGSRCRSRGDGRSRVGRRRSERRCARPRDAAEPELLDCGWDERDPAQQHRRPGARPAARTGRRPRHPVPRSAHERDAAP